MIKNKINFEKLMSTIEVYIQEAERCGDVELYFAGCVMFGSALEACLFCFLLSNLNEHEHEHEHEQPSVDELGGTRFFDLINECKNNGVFSSSKKVKPMDPHQIRKMRNLIHPIKLASSGESITKDTYLSVRDDFYLAKEHLFYWITGDCDVEYE